MPEAFRQRHALVRVDDDPLEADGIAQRHENRGELHRRAVRVRDDPLVCLQVVWVHLADHERHSRIHAPGVGVVDDRGTPGDRQRGEHFGCGSARREERDVDAIEGAIRCLEHLMPDATDGERRTGRPLGGEETQLPYRELPFEQDLDHRPTDDPGGPDDGDGERLAGHPGHGSTASFNGTGHRPSIAARPRAPGGAPCSRRPR